MKIFMTGATGLLGRYFIEENPSPRDLKILGLSKMAHPEAFSADLGRLVACDFSDQTKLEKLILDFKPDVIIHAGGEGNVDQVEKNPQRADQNNLKSSRFLMKVAERLSAKWIFFSSNAVYDGNHPPFNEGSAAAPSSLYGTLKSEVDRETRNFPGKWVIFRPTVSYGWNFPFGRKNPVTHFLPEVMKGQEIRLVTDQFENPLYAGDSAAVLWKILKSDFLGEINVAGGDAQVSRFDWIRQASSAFGIMQPALIPAKRADFMGAHVVRALDTSFDTRKLQSVFEHPMKNVFEGAQAMKADIQRAHFT